VRDTSPSSSKGALLTRVPLALRYPGRIAAGQSARGLACGTDIAPTILDAAGLRFDKPVDGESLLPLATDPSAPARESLLVETYGHGFGTIELGRTLITERHKLIAYQNHPSELYDLMADPYELHNLYGQPAYEALIDELEAELRRWLRETGDRDFDQPISDAFRALDRQRLEELLARRARANDASG